MRNSLAALVLMLAAGACGTDPAVGGDDTGGGGGSGSGDPSDLAPPARGFQLKSPEITIPANSENTYCWYFKAPNAEALTIKKWSSRMTEGSHHMIVFFTKSATQPEGTVSDSSCGITSGTNVATWIYAAQNRDAELALPGDDGSGRPLGMDVASGQTGFIQMHYLNPTDEALKVHVTLNAEAYEAGVDTTKTFAYITYNSQINIPDQAVGDKEGGSCAIPSTQKIWLISTHAHKQAVHTEVRDGSDVVFSSDNWEEPGAKAWMSTPFYTFNSGKITYECTYNNNTGRTITSGDSAATDEMCMATGYIFPATKPTICLNSSVVPF